MTTMPGSNSLHGWEGHSLEEWRVRLGVPALEFHAELPSTNDLGKELARTGAGPFTLIIAGRQTAGRGRGGKEWVSPAGAGLWASILLPTPPGGPPGVATLAVGVAAAEAVEAVVPGLRIGLKWPNDLVVGSPWRKLGGILTELVSGPREPILVVGVGINLHPGPGAWERPEVREGATYLSDWLDPQAGDGAPDPTLLPVLAEQLVTRLRHWAHPPPDTLRGELRVEWERRDVLAGKAVTMESGPTGTAVGVAPDGTLRMACDDGKLRSVTGGGVRLRES